MAEPVSRAELENGIANLLSRGGSRKEAKRLQRILDSGRAIFRNGGYIYAERPSRLGVDVRPMAKHGMAARVVTLQAEIVELKRMLEISMRGEFLALERVDQLEAQLKNQVH